MKCAEFIRKCVWAILNSLKQFLQNSTLHGVRYIAATDRRVVERILWLVMVIGAFIFMAQLSYNTWIHFSSSVTVTTISTTNYPVSEVHFPSVAICTNTRYENNLDHIVYHMTSQMGIDENRSRAFIDQLDSLIRPREIDEAGVKEIEAGLLKSKITLDSLVRTLTVPCKELIPRCQWLGRARNCDHHFRLITTARGFCCAFNYYGDIHDDVTEEKAENVLKHLALAGHENGLIAMVNLGDAADDQYAQVMITHPFNFFDMIAKTCRVGAQQELYIPVRPTTVSSTPGVQTVDVSRRSCYFDNEIDLKSSSIYSYSTCVTQCQMDQIWKVCRCIPFFYLRSDNRRNCTMTDVPCLYENRGLVTDLRPKNQSAGCKCLPRCNAQWYEMGCFVSKLAHHDYTTSSFIREKNVSSVGIVSVAWADTLSIKYTRDISLTWDTFLGSFGGILSLCVGGSVLSVVELLYFIFIRTCAPRMTERPGRRKRKKVMAPAPTGQPTLQLFWAEFTQNMLSRSKKRP